MLVCRMLAPLAASMFVAVVTVVVVEKNAVHLPFQRKILILNAERLKTPRAKKNHRRKRIETGQACLFGSSKVENSLTEIYRNVHTFFLKLSGF